MAEAVLLAGVRTPIGSLNGSLAELSAPELGAACVQESLQRAGLGGDPSVVDEVIMGNVIGAGIGQNPARQASLKAGLPPSVGATTINKVCGSGLKAVMLATQAIRLGDAQLIVAGGLESMSRAPYLLPRARQGYRLGHGELLDATIHDGLWDVYDGQHMGVYGDRCAVECDFSRQAQDDFAVRSYTRAREAQARGWFEAELVPITLPARKPPAVVVSVDEEPQRFDEAKLRGLRPVFSKEGTITAGNASTINDGAAALVVASSEFAATRNLSPLARIMGMSTFSREPAKFTLAPIGAIQLLLQQLGWKVGDVDLFEVNEAFSVVALAAQRELKLPDDRLNVHGGAVALGHPIGCSGARILVTLLHALRKRGGGRGIACLCIGGGEAVALGIECPGE